MDKNNLQINNSSGNEFALRVALCDLVQRLKRSEFMCKYLEQCRNELANEVIKLRTHNNLLLKELVENPSSPLGRSNTFNNQLQHQQNSSNQLPEPLNQTDYKKSVKLDSIVDESWEEITNRLINQLKNEILNAESEEKNQLNQNDEIQEKKSTICSSGSNYFDLKSDHNADHNLVVNEANEYETQEQHMAINDLNDVKTDENRETNRELNKQLSKQLSKELSKDHNNKDDKMKLTFKQLLEDYSLMNTNNNLKVIEVHENKDQKCNIYELLKDYISQDKQSNQLDLVQKILHNYNRDLDEITNQIMLQNDKLVKLKGKQIRNYFRKQLDINKSNGSGPNSNSELKINN